jgi:hypothetical protein
VAGVERSSRDPGDQPRTCRADAVATPQRLQQGVRDRLCAAARTPWRRRQGVPCDPALGGAQQDVQVPTNDGRELVMSRYTEALAEQRLLMDRLRLVFPEQPRPRITNQQADLSPDPM